MTAVEVFELAVSCYLRELDEAEYAALVRRVRPPKDQCYPAKRRRGRSTAVDVKNVG
ncbi:hypothetical protein ACVWWN_000318 [Mycobacterium sp. URHB0021]